MNIQLEKLLIELAIIAIEKEYLNEANTIYYWIEQLNEKYQESALLLKILILLKENKYQDILAISEQYQHKNLMPFFALSAQQLGLEKVKNDFLAKLASNNKENADLINFTLALIENY